MSPKIAIWLNIIYAICTGITAPMLDAMGIADGTKVVAWMTAIGMAVNVIMHAYSSQQPGPLSQDKKDA